MIGLHCSTSKLRFTDLLQFPSVLRNIAQTAGQSLKGRSNSELTTSWRLRVQGLTQASRAPMDKAVASVDPVERPSMGSLLDEKKSLRKQVRQELRQLSPDQRAREDEAVQQHVITSPWFKNSQRMNICAYISCPALREVGTERLVAEILQSPENVLYVPRVEDKDSHMRMLRITNTTVDVVPNSMNILEPTPTLSDGSPREDLMQAGEPLDMLLMPGLAFDQTGGRLGRGGGYYDVFIRSYMERAREKGWKKPLLVALTYKLQIRDQLIPMDKTDVAVDALVCHEGLIARKGGPLDLSQS